MFQSSASKFIFDFPQIFEAVLIERMSLDPSKIQFLYSIGSLPNIISILLTSVILPKIGVGLLVLIVQTFGFLGAALTYLAVSHDAYWVLCAGRIFVGMSNELSILGILLSCEKWFRGRLLTISLGCGRFFRLIHSSASIYFLPKIYLGTRNVESSAFVCVLVTFVVFCMTAVFAVLDIKFDHLHGVAKKSDHYEHEDESAELKETLNRRSQAVEEKPDSGTREQVKEFTLRHLKYIPLKGWLLVIFNVLTINVYFQLTNTGSDFLAVRYKLSYVDAKNTLTLVPLIAAVILPFFSAFYTKFGQKPLGIFIASLAATGCYGCLALTPAPNPSFGLVLAMIFMAVHYGMCYGGVFSSLLLSVPKEASSLILVLTITLQNVLMTLMPIISGRIYQDRTSQTYQNWVYFMVVFSILAAICSLAIFLVDLKGDRLLKLPENDPRAMRIQEKMSRDFQGRILQRRSGKERSISEAVRE